MYIYICVYTRMHTHIKQKALKSFKKAFILSTNMKTV